MTPEQMQKLVAALEAALSGDAEAAATLIKEAIAGGTPEAPAEASGAVTDAAPEPAAVPAVDPNAPANSAADAPATAMLLRVTGAKSLAEAEPILRTAITSAATNETQRRSLDLVARRELIVSLIEMGAETPATAWDGKPEDRKPKARLLSEPLEEMRARVTSLKGRGTQPVDGHAPPESQLLDVTKAVSELSADTLAAIKKKGITPEAFVAERAKATRRLGSGRTQ